MSPNPGKISPLPPVYVADGKGELFDVDIEISEVENVYSCGFTIAYESTLIEARHVSKGDFFPDNAQFNSCINGPAGLIDVNMSLSDSHGSLSGSGVLAKLLFEVMEAPLENVGSPLSFLSIRLHDQSLMALDYKSVSAVFFWKSIQPKEFDGDRQVDLYTPKGGKGLGISGGWFEYGGLVILRAYASYAGWPEQNALVAFEVLNPLNETALIMVAETNEFGIAETSFRIPEVKESIGAWTVISTVDVACIVVWDTLTFKVSTPVGGETSIIQRSFGYSLYSVFVGVLATVLAASNRAFKRITISSSSNSRLHGSLTSDKPSKSK